MQGATSTAAWLRDRWLVSPGTASRLVKLAAVLDAALPLSAQALAAGAVNTEQVQVIGEAVTGLPEEHRRRESGSCWIRPPCSARGSWAGWASACSRWSRRMRRSGWRRGGAAAG